MSSLFQGKMSTLFQLGVSFCLVSFCVAGQPLVLVTTSVEPSRLFEVTYGTHYDVKTQLSLTTWQTPAGRHLPHLVTVNVDYSAPPASPTTYTSAISHEAGELEAASSYNYTLPSSTTVTVPAVQRDAEPTPPPVLNPEVGDKIEGRGKRSRPGPDGGKGRSDSGATDSTIKFTVTTTTTASKSTSKRSWTSPAPTKTSKSNRKLETREAPITTMHPSEYPTYVYFEPDNTDHPNEPFYPSVTSKLWPTLDIEEVDGVRLVTFLSAHWFFTSIVEVRNHQRDVATVESPSTTPVDSPVEIAIVTAVVTAVTTKVESPVTTEVEVVESPVTIDLASARRTIKATVPAETTAASTSNATVTSTGLPDLQGAATAAAKPDNGLVWAVVGALVLAA